MPNNATPCRCPKSNLHAACNPYDCGKEKLTYEEFKALKEVKHLADLDVNDVIYLADPEERNIEDCEFSRVTVTGRCGHDDFWGRTDSGTPKAWPGNAWFKIISMNINLTHLNQSK